MPAISAVIITFNEERNIARCLDSVKGIADDIVVLDSGSTDATVRLAEAAGARVFLHPFDDYVAQKNRAVARAACPHILALDADEALSGELRASVAAAKQNWQYDGYRFNRLTSYCGRWIRHGSWYPDCRIRLWNSAKGRWAGNRIHEIVVLDEGSSAGFLRGDLLHYSIDSIDQHIARINKYTDISARAAFDRGRRTNLFEISLLPKWKFFRDYVVKRGFLDGFYGYVICKNSAYADYLKLLKLYRLSKDSGV
jgi:glycosyltransferase involved in cell wall biosynthesis